MFSIPCVIFAGGKSSRMGEDKSLLPFSTYPTLTQYQYHKLSQYFHTIYISTKERKKFDFSASFIEDEGDIYAPTIGFYSSFKQLQVEKIFAISVDTPFVTEDIITKIIQNDTQNADATIARVDGKMQPLCGIYHSSLQTKFQDMIQKEEHKLGYLLRNAATHYVDFEDEKAFLNLNHPHEYQEALSLLTQ